MDVFDVPGVPDCSTDTGALFRPQRLYSRAEVLSRPCPVPAEPGVYAWYFDAPPAPVPTDGCHRTGDGVLLYVGISPKAPPGNGRPPSRQSLRTRIRYHYRGNAAGSTLRLTLGSLLADELGIRLRRVGSGIRLTFGASGEQILSAWMHEHARVCWMTNQAPWLVEERLIAAQYLPLNLDQNKHSRFHQSLSGLRAHQRAVARALPVLPG